MAVTNNKKQEELARQTTPVQSSTPYSGLAGVSENTARNLGNYQQGYQQSEAVTAAQQNLAQIQAQKPQGYTSKYSGALDSIMEQIQNPQEFRYEFNGDNLFKNYADLYSQYGKQASADAMGQAAALTGGYGNSYAQQAGQQGYQQYMLALYDKGLELRDRAYQQHQDKQANLQDQYNLLMNADTADYNKYRDTIADWQREEELAAQRAAQEREFDYGQYADALGYFTNLAGMENSAYNTQQSLAEQIRQANLDEQYRRDTLAYQQARDTKGDAMSYVQAITANGQMPSAALLKAAGISEEDARRMILLAQEPASAGGGSGGGPGKSGNGNTYYADYDSTGKIRYFQKNANGSLTEVSASKAKKGKINTVLYDTHVKSDTTITPAVNMNGALAKAAPAGGTVAPKGTGVTGAAASQAAKNNLPILNDNDYWKKIKSVK